MAEQASKPATDKHGRMQWTGPAKRHATGHAFRYSLVRDNPRGPECIHWEAWATPADTPPDAWRPAITIVGGGFTKAEARRAAEQHNAAQTNVER